VCSHCPFQLVEQLWVDSIDRINQRRHGGVRRGSEESAHGVLRTSALDQLPSYPCTIDESPAVPLALDQSLVAKSIDNLRNGRVDQGFRSIQPAMHVANGSRTEFPELRQNGIFQFVRW